MSATVVIAFKGFTEYLLQYSLLLKDLLSVSYSSHGFLRINLVTATVVIAFKGFTECQLQ